MKKPEEISQQPANTITPPGKENKKPDNHRRQKSIRGRRGKVQEKVNAIKTRFNLNKKPWEVSKKIDYTAQLGDGDPITAATPARPGPSQAPESWGRERLNNGHREHEKKPESLNSDPTKESELPVPRASSTERISIPAPTPEKKIKTPTTSFKPEHAFVQKIAQLKTQAEQKEGYKTSLKSLIVYASQADTKPEYKPAKLAFIQNEALLLKAVDYVLTLQPDQFRLLPSDIDSLFGIGTSSIPNIQKQKLTPRSPKPIRNLNSVFSSAGKAATSPNFPPPPPGTSETKQLTTTPQTIVSPIPGPPNSPPPQNALSPSPLPPPQTTPPPLKTTTASNPISPSTPPPERETPAAPKETPAGETLLRYVYTLLSEHKEFLARFNPATNSNTASPLAVRPPTKKPTETLNTQPQYHTPAPVTQASIPLARRTEPTPPSLELLSTATNATTNYRAGLTKESKQQLFDSRLGWILKQHEKKMKAPARLHSANYLIHCCREVINRITLTIKSKDQQLSPQDKQDQLNAIKLLAWCYANKEEKSTIESPYLQLQKIYNTFIELDQCEGNEEKEMAHKIGIKKQVWLALQNLNEYKPEIIQKDELLHFFVEAIDMACDTVVQYSTRKKSQLGQTPADEKTVEAAKGLTQFIGENFSDVYKKTPENREENRIKANRIKAIINNYYPKYRNTENFAIHIKQSFFTQSEAAEKKEEKIKFLKQGSKIETLHRLITLDQSCLQQLIIIFIDCITQQDKELLQDIRAFFKELKEPTLVSWHFYQYTLKLQNNDNLTNTKKYRALIEAINLNQYNTAAQLQIAEIESSEANTENSVRRDCKIVLEQPLRIKLGNEAETFYAHRAQAAKILCSLGKEGKTRESILSQSTNTYRLLDKAYSTLQQQKNAEKIKLVRSALFHCLSTNNESQILMLTAYIHLCLECSTNLKTASINKLLCREVTAELRVSLDQASIRTIEQNNQLITQVLNSPLRYGRFQRKPKLQQQIKINALKLAYLKALLDWKKLNPEKEKALPNDSIKGFGFTYLNDSNSIKTIEIDIKNLIKKLDNKLKQLNKAYNAKKSKGKRAFPILGSK